MTSHIRRPIAVTLISFVYIAAGTLGIIYHASDLKNIFSQGEAAWILVVRLLAIVGGIFALRGSNWARWLLVAWIAYHVYLSFYHEVSELIIHIVLMIVTGTCLFYKGANAFFSGGNVKSA